MKKSVLIICLLAISSIGSFSQTKIDTVASAQKNSLKEIEQAYDYYNRKEWEKASQMFEELQKQNPYYHDFAVRLAFSYFNLAKYDESIVAFQKALETGPWTDIYSYQIARCYAQKNEPQKAIEWLNRAVQNGWSDYPRLQSDEVFKHIKERADFMKILGQSPIPARNRTERWRKDLDFLYEKMSVLHYDMFNATSKEKWEESKALLSKRIPTLSDSQVVIELMKIAALAGEGHTKVLPANNGELVFHALPLTLFHFKDATVVTEAPPSLQDVLGLRVVAIGGKSIKELDKLSYRYAGHENMLHHKKIGPRFLVMLEALQDMGATTNGKKVSVTFTDKNGKLVEKVIEAVTLEQSAKLRSAGWLQANQQGGKSLPLFLSRPDEDYWFQDFAEQSLLYVQIKFILNDGNKRFSDFCETVFKYIDENKLQYLVIDLRNAGGGNSALNRFLIERLLQHPNINKQGKLFTLIGRNTYSAAVNLVSDLEYRTNTVFIGEPTGSSPNFIGESNVLKLPYSGLNMVISDRYHQGGANNSRDKRKWIAPTILIEPDSESYLNGFDPVMDYVQKSLIAK